MTIDRELYTPAAPKRYGLRFQHRADATRLRQWADRVKAGDLKCDISTLEVAADAAELGEPLIVVCNHANEAVELAAFYTLMGLDTPTIEQLSGA